MASPAWSKLRKEDEWLKEAMERSIRESNRTPEQFRAKASKLRAQAQETDIKGVHDACLTLAAHYEHAAAERLTA